MTPQTPQTPPLWLFDSSTQTLVYLDPESGEARGFSEQDLRASGWNVDGLRLVLPRCSTQPQPQQPPPSPSRIIRGR